MDSAAFIYYSAVRLSFIGELITPSQIYLSPELKDGGQHTINTHISLDETQMHNEMVLGTT